MPELRHDPVPGLADLTGMSLKDLAELDDALLDRTLERLLPACGGVGGRLWQNNAENYPADS